jgi:hypothetical protein
LPSRYRRGPDGLRARLTIERMTKTLTAALVLIAVAAGCSSSGAQEAGPVPTGQATTPTSTGQTTGSTTTGSTSIGSTSTSTQSAALCKDRTAAVKVASQEGAAGTISTVWRVTNTSSSACRSFGYPGMDFHTKSGWLNVQVNRGGFPNIDVSPQPVVLGPGQSLYFVSYWNDVDTSAGPCKQFDRVKVTLPDNFTSARLASTGCLAPTSVDVGPVSKSRPS